MFRRTYRQSSFIWSRGCPRYWKVGTFYTLSSPSSPSILKYTPPHLEAISTFFRRSRISINLWYLYDCQCLKSLSAYMCILHWSHCGNGYVPSCKMATLNFQWQNIKCSLSLLGVLPWPGIPPPGSPPTLGSEEMTPYRPPVFLPWCPHPSPAAVLYNVISPYDVVGKRHPLSHHTPRNLL